MSGRPTILQICERPRIYVIDRFATPREMTHVDALAGNRRELARRGVEVPPRNDAGVHFELPCEGDPRLEGLAARMERAVGAPPGPPSWFRYRCYREGEHHRAHQDLYRIDGDSLVVTAFLYLNDTEAGGETFFPQARPSPVFIHPKRGRLAIWFNLLPNGRADRAALHEALPVIRGEKRTLANFIYRPRAFAAHALRARTRPARPRFSVVV